MKQLPQYLIMLLAGFVLGFGGVSVVQIGQKKLRTAVFLAEAEGEVLGLRQRVAQFKAAQGRFPRDPGEMVTAGFWRVDEPPVERLRGSANWVTAYDGEGGFVYLSPSGKIYLNTDLKREKFLSTDKKKLMTGDLLPPGTFF